MIKYLNVIPESKLPEIQYYNPFKAVILVEDVVSEEWQNMVSSWLIKSGCKYMMTWGINSSYWDDSVDLANLKLFNYENIPEEDFVITTWHSDESIEEVFEFCKRTAFHPVIKELNTVIIHIGTSDRGEEILSIFHKVSGDGSDSR